MPATSTKKAPLSKKEAKPKKQPTRRKLQWINDFEHFISKAVFVRILRSKVIQETKIPLRIQSGAVELLREYVESKVVFDLDRAGSLARYNNRLRVGANDIKFPKILCSDPQTATTYAEFFKGKKGKIDPKSNHTVRKPLMYRRKTRT